MNAMTDYRTAYSVQPKLPPAKAKPLAPGMSFADDAKRCNARLKKHWGETGNANNCTAITNTMRMAVARARDEAMFPVILAMLETGPKTRKQICDGTGLTDDTSKRVLQRMKSDGVITGSGHHRIKWERAAA